MQRPAPRSAVAPNPSALLRTGRRHPGKRAVGAVTAFVGAIVLAAFCAPSHALDLQEDIRGLLVGAGLDRATISISVRDATTGRELYELAGARPMIPASNMKLFTSGAALHLLGPEFEFSTRIRLDGDRLWIIGDGDPAFGDPDLLATSSWIDPDGNRQVGLDVDTLLGIVADSIVGELAREGRDSIEELVIDDRVFDREFFHPGWPADQRDKSYCAEVAGFNFHLNVLEIHARPLGGTRPDIAHTRPAAPWLDIRNQATARTGRGQRTQVGVARQAESNRLTFWGNVARATSVSVTLHDMPTFMARVIADRLEDRGIEVGSARIARADDPVPGGRSIGPSIRTPIETALTRCNTASENVYAESLLKRLAHGATGAPGSWTEGARLVRMVAMERVGDAALLEEFRLSDGSGLSRRNRISASLTTAWLADFERDEKLGPILRRSLADAGENGTVRKRFGELDPRVEVDCKTGYINGVSCLSGVISGPHGDVLTFSVLCNDLDRIPSEGVRRAKKLQEAVVRAIARDITPAPARLGG